MLECILDSNNNIEPLLGFCSCGTIFEIDGNASICPGCGAIYYPKDIRPFYGQKEIILLPDDMWHEVRESEESNVQEKE